MDYHKLFYLTERDEDRDSTLVHYSVIGVSLVNRSHEDKQTLPIVKSVPPKEFGDLVIPIKLVKYLQQAGAQDAEFLGGEVRVYFTGVAGSKTSSGKCHYCGEKITLEDREQVILSGNSNSRDFHVDCYNKFTTKLENLIEEHKTELAVYNI